MAVRNDLVVVLVIYVTGVVIGTGVVTMIVVVTGTILVVVAVGGVSRLIVMVMRIGVVVRSKSEILFVVLLVNCDT